MSTPSHINFPLPWYVDIFIYLCIYVCITLEHSSGCTALILILTSTLSPQIVEGQMVHESVTIGHFESVIIVHFIQTLCPSPSLVLFCNKQV